MQRAATAVSAATSRTIFSGIQPTGIPHLGNYAGAIRQWVDLQQAEDKPALIYSIVDLHAITTPQSPDRLRANRKECLAALLAAGLDPARCTIFYQSAVPAHAELMWILSCTASVGYLSRMTQWKQKLSLGSESSLENKAVGSRLKLGLFSYPVLQAADILLHRATHVPVGDDQRQHLEFARECATNFNAAYGSHLVHPETITPPAHRIRSLVDPTAKMSKSHTSERSRILITDSPTTIEDKIRVAKTDSILGISYDPTTRPGISSLLDIWSVFDTKRRTPEGLAEEHAGLSPKEFKTGVSRAVIEGLHGVREKYLSAMKDGDLEVIAEFGATKARARAEETMEMVREAVGLARPR